MQHRLCQPTSALLLSSRAGTEEHRIYQATNPAYTGTGVGTHTDTGTGTHTGTTDMGTHTGATDIGHTGLTGTGMGTHTGTTAGVGTMGHHDGEKKGLGEKLKEVLPGEGWPRGPCLDVVFELSFSRCWTTTMV